MAKKKALDLPTDKKVSFNEATAARRGDRFDLAMYWDEAELKFDGKVDLPLETQEQMLHYYLLHPKPFKKVCNLYGITDKETIQHLEDRIPLRWKLVKAKIEDVPDLDLGIDKNVEEALKIVAAGLRQVDAAKRLLEIEIEAGVITPRRLRDLSMVWSAGFDRLMPLLTEGIIEGRTSQNSGLGKILGIGQEQMDTLKVRYREVQIERTAESLLSRGKENDTQAIPTVESSPLVLSPGDEGGRGDSVDFTEENFTSNDEVDILKKRAESK